MAAVTSMEEFQKKVQWFKENLKVGQTIKFKEKLQNYGEPKITEYRGIYLGLIEETRRIHILVGIFDKENNTTLKREFNVISISDIANSRLPKVISDDIKKKFLPEDNENSVKAIKEALDNQIIVRSFKTNTFLLLNKELDTIEGSNQALGRIYNLKLDGDIGVLNSKYPNFNSNFSFLTAKHFKNFVENESISICPMVLAKPAGSQKTVYYQATEIKLNKKLSTAKQKELIDVLKCLTNVK